MVTMETNQDIVKIAEHLDSQASVFKQLESTMAALEKAVQ